METEATDDNHQEQLVNYDTGNELIVDHQETDDDNDLLGYHSEEYPPNNQDIEEEDEDEDNNLHLDGHVVVKRGITRLYKFRQQYGKPNVEKLSVTFDALNRISGAHRALFSSFLGDVVREQIGLKVLSWRKVDSEARNKLWDEISVYTYTILYLYIYVMCNYI